MIMGTMDNEQRLLETVEIDREEIEEILRESVKSVSKYHLISRHV